MSVVNQMLKDLEQREQAQTGGASAVYQAPAQQTSSKTRLLIGLLIVSVLILGGALVWTFFTSPVSEDTAQDSTTEVQSSLPEASLNERPSVARPMQVNTPKTDPEPEVVVTNETTEPEASSPAESVPGTEAIDTQSDVLTPPASSVDTLAHSSVHLPEQADVEVPEEQPQAVFSKQSSSAEQQGVSLREQALAAVRAGQDTQAIALLERLIASESDNVAARKKLAALLFANGQAIRAQAVLESGIQQQPQESSMRLMLSRLLAQQQLTQSAFDTLNPGIELQPITVEFLSYRASLADQLSEFDVALADYQRLTQLQPAEARWWLGLGIASERNQQSNLALEAYQKALALNQLSIDVQRFVQQRSALLVGVE